MPEHIFFDNIRNAIKAFKTVKTGEIMGCNRTNTVSDSNICSGGHTAIWAGAADYVLPEGYPCSCGQTAVHYYTCPTCGHRKMEMR